MQLDSKEVSRVYPWVKELWLFAPPDPRSASVDLLVVSAIPPRQVGPGQRKRLLVKLQGQSLQQLDLRLTTRAQLVKWLARGGRFTTRFRRHAIKLFERPDDDS